MKTLMKTLLEHLNEASSTNEGLDSRDQLIFKKHFVKEFEPSYIKKYDSDYEYIWSIPAKALSFCKDIENDKDDEDFYKEQLRIIDSFLRHIESTCRSILSNKKILINAVDDDDFGTFVEYVDDYFSNVVDALGFLYKYKLIDSSTYGIYHKAERGLAKMFDEYRNGNANSSLNIMIDIADNLKKIGSNTIYDDYD